MMGVTWAVADDLLRAAPSASERLAQLQRITSLDLPVPGGSGSARYGCAPLKDRSSSPRAGHPLHANSPVLGLWGTHFVCFLGAIHCMAERLVMFHSKRGRGGVSMSVLRELQGGASSVRVGRKRS